MNIPYSFVAGTKAIAEEVNENFRTVAEEIESLATTVVSNKSSLEATLQSNLSTINSTIEELQENLEKNQVGLSLENISSTGILNCINWIMPNYSSGSSFSCPYTTTKPGWVYLGGKQDVTSSIYIGGVYFEISYDTGDG
ncbi:MAG: hypothetical protein LUH11_03755, partial [Candidatus Gastranaerophilales bacterium]|nr:hypothetical protein [Candidatus Gastranaerophilales bacterium]